MKRAEKGHRPDWYPNYSFDVLSMMEDFTDERLAELGMDAETIKAYRAREKELKEKKERREEREAREKTG